MNGRLRITLVTAALALVAGCTHANRPQPLAGQEEEVGHLLQGCAYGLERILPGDYYFCEAASHYWAGRFGMARDALHSAASWASKPAEHALGIMYFNGDHAEKNRPLGVAWLALAAERHEPDYETVFVSAYQTLSPQERAQADAYWLELKPKYDDSYAALRAQRRYDREMHQLETAALFGGDLYLSGLTQGSVKGVSLLQRLRNEGNNYFAGYQTHVWVGDAQLVPLGQVPPAKKDEPSKSN